MTEPNQLSMTHEIERLLAEAAHVSDAMMFQAEVDIAQAQETARRLQAAPDAVNVAIKAAGETLARFFVQSTDGGCHGIRN